MTDRYIVTEPVKGGYAWWDVRDRLDIKNPNRTMASFFKDLPGAEFLARNLCERLNKQETTVN